MSESLIKVENVSKKFCRSLKKSLWYGMKDLGRELIGRTHGGNDDLRPDEFWAVKDVSFELKRGECLGLIGRNGAGKTTLLRMLNGLIKPDKGRIEMRGRVGALIALGAGFNPILTGRENIYVNASVLGLKKKEIDAKFDEIVEFAELGDFIDSPVQSYSSGMAVRLGFAIAITIRPDILLIDEVLAVGDLSFQKKAYTAISNILKHAAVIFVSHSVSQITKVSNRAMLLKKGRTDGININVGEIIEKYFADNQSNSVCDFGGRESSALTKIQIKSNLNSYNIDCCSKMEPKKIVIKYGSPIKMCFLIKLNISTKFFHIEVEFIDVTMKGIAQCISVNKNKSFCNNGIPTWVCFNLDYLTLNRGKYYLNLRIYSSDFRDNYLFDPLCFYDNLLEIQVISDNIKLGGSPIQLDVDWSQVSKIQDNS